MKVNDYRFWKSRIETAPANSRGAFDQFVQDQRPMAQEPRNMYAQGQLVQPSNDGSRPGYAKITEKGKSTPKGGRPIPENIVMADDTKAIKELQNKIDKLNRVNKLDDKGVKFKVVKTQAGNYTTELSYVANDYRKAIGKNKSTGSLNKLIEEFNQFKKTNLFKNYSKSASMKAGGVKSAKKQLADIGSKKEDVFNYLLNNKNASIEEIAKNLKLKEGVVRTNLQGLYTDIYKRTADQGAVYLKDFNTNQLDSVHSSIKNTKVPLKDRVKNLVIDAYKGDKNLKPILEKLDNFYTLQSEIKKTPYGKFFAANLDHPVPLNFIRQLEEGADPFNLIKIRPIPEFLNQRAFKAQFDRVLGTAYRTGNKKALEAIVNVQSYLPQEFGGITPDGKIKDYGAKPFSLKTDLTQSNFGDIYKRVFDFIKNPELQETFKESKVSFKNLASQEKNIMKQVKGLSSFMKSQGIACRLANGVNCNMPQAYTKSLNELSEKAAQGNTEAASKLKNFSSKALKTGKVLKNVLGPLAIASEVALEGGIALNKTLETGVPFKQAFGESYLNKLLGPKLQIDVEAERAKEMARGEEYAMAERGRRKAPFVPQSAQADELRRIKAMKRMEEVYPTASKLDIDLGLQNAGMTQQETGMTYPEIQDYIKREDQMQAIADAGGVANMAGGGIAGLSGGDPSGAMLESMNPDSQGLRSLYKNGRKL